MGALQASRSGNAAYGERSAAVGFNALIGGITPSAVQACEAALADGCLEVPGVETAAAGTRVNLPYQR